MRRLRRAVALLMNLLLLQAGVLGGGAACASRLAAVGGSADIAAAPAAQDSDDAGHGAAHHGGHGSAEHHAPADRERDGDATVPTGHHGPAHCTTSATCASMALASAAVTPPAEAVTTSPAVVARFDALRSTSVPPETPPPRV
jgi:hypothetical protein